MKGDYFVMIINPKNKSLAMMTASVFVVVAVVVIFVLQLFTSAGPRVNHGPQGKSSSQVRTILQSLHIYSSAHGDAFLSQQQFPAALIEMEYMEEDQFVSPVAKDDSSSYIYVPGPCNFDAKQILIYENPTHWENFVIVGFADAHVEKLDHATFNRMLAEQMQD